MQSGTSARGAYGFRLEGVDEARSLLVEADDWPVLELIRVTDGGGGGPPMDVLGPDRARLPLSSGGWIDMDRRRGRLTFHLADDLADEDLVHPAFSGAAGIATRWVGREAFHAGAVIIGDGAYGLLGDKEMGKSTTLAWLATHGHDVLVDDFLALDGEHALAGPRCIDLRAPAAELLGVGEPRGVIGLRERFRLRLPPCPSRVRLRGWLVLEWGDDVALEPLRGAERLLALLPHRAVQLVPPAPEALVELSSWPVWRLRRPRDPAALPAVGELLARLPGR